MDQKTWRKKLNHRIGERIFLDTHKDYLTGNIKRTPVSLYLAYGIAGFVLLTPILMVMLGVWVFTLDFPNILFIILGVVISASGWKLMPPRLRNFDKTYRRDALPALFTFFDTVGGCAGRGADRWHSHYA